MPIISVRGVVTDKSDGNRSDNLKYRNRAKTVTSIRTFPLPTEIADFLTQQKVRQDENRRLAGDSYSVKWDGFVCVDAIGEIIRPEYLSRAFRQFLQKHGLRHIRFHELRDSSASLLLDNDVDMKRIQSWLGHANYSTTADRYAHLRVDAKLKLGAVLSKELASK